MLDGKTLEKTRLNITVMSAPLCKELQAYSLVPLISSFSYSPLILSPWLPSFWGSNFRIQWESRRAEEMPVGRQLMDKPIRIVGWERPGSPPLSAALSPVLLGCYTLPSVMRNAAGRRLGKTSGIFNHNRLR
ncbi:hypothetical protein E2C01_016476 [Portunus trituberculatus]|uniref:Uncharacterized protein n=1 Tax=Portunus trituberculatus TaxID=210409 RepID=A0A5B7DQT4_PORTR|nr:hypothetical protein [Portunus trituberculatus]